MKAPAFEPFAINAHTICTSAKTALFMTKTPITNAVNPPPTELQIKTEIMFANISNHWKLHKLQKKKKTFLNKLKPSLKRNKNMKASHHPLFHKILQQLKIHNIQNKKLLIAVSGGIDSISLLDLMTEVSRPLKLKLNMAHIHHGKTKSPYRNQTQIFVHCLAEGLNLPFFSNKPTENNKNSERELRKIRYKYLHQWMKKSQSDYLVLAHTSDDLLETRLIRLIRGTGKDGVQAMRFLNQPLLRPLLFFTKSEIKKYALFRKLQWVEDPTNIQTKTLRNWMRHKWLKELEQKQKGSFKNLALSLERLSDINEEEDSSIITSKGLDRKKMLELSYYNQKKWVARYMRKSQLKNYGSSHIQEILKYLHHKNKNQKIHLLGKIWIFTPSFLKISSRKN